ncbi:MAG: hypothetical protein WCE64_05100 [Bacteroidales bacterium]
MSFIPISFDDFIKIHAESNPSTNTKVLRIKLESAIEAYRNGNKCSCGNDILIVGAATNSFKCFQCITGKPHPTGEYEIESVIDKVDRFGRRHIDEMDPRKISGIFDDDGYEINPDLIKKPPLCSLCRKNYEPEFEDEIFCNLNRNDQRDNDKFICHSYEQI